MVSFVPLFWAVAPTIIEFFPEFHMNYLHNWTYLTKQQDASMVFWSIVLFVNRRSLLIQWKSVETVFYLLNSKRSNFLITVQKTTFVTFGGAFESASISEFVLDFETSILSGETEYWLWPNKKSNNLIFNQDTKKYVRCNC